MAADWSNIRVYHKDDLERLIKSAHTASAAARPDRDEYRMGHTAALIALCMAIGIDPTRIGLVPASRPNVIADQSNDGCYS